ncbi:MAG TPA: hypothetical protein PKA61_02015 [Nitrospira sp.]|nr:hypothetical protein [Nitrospira sp.]
MNRGRIPVIVMSLVVSVIVSAMTLVVAQPFLAKAQETKRFQYRIVEVLHDTDSMQQALNEFGGGGWELVAVSAGNLTSPKLIFKK